MRFVITLYSIKSLSNIFKQHLNFVLKCVQGLCPHTASVTILLKFRHFAN